MGLMDLATNAAKGMAGVAFKEVTGADPKVFMTAIKTGGAVIPSNSWDDLNNHLIVKLYAVDFDGKLALAKGQVVPQIVSAVFVGDVNLEVGLNWQSPFEGAGAESKAPALMSMLQSGAFQPIIDSLGGKTQEVFQDTISEARGRTGITKLNSTQVFSGMPPIKISGTLMLRAWGNSVREVETPLNQLMQWALPQELAQGLTIAGNLLEAAKDQKTLLEAIMPSLAPHLVAVTYKGRTYSPMVIENINVPLHSPIDSYGNFTQLMIPVTISSLTALDGMDWLKTMTKGF